MSGDWATRWIRTDRVDPRFRILDSVFSSLLAVAMIHLFVVTTPQFAVWIRLAIVVAVGVPLAAWYWRARESSRAIAVRVSRTGIEIQRRYGGIYRIPRGSMTLRRRGPAGCGTVRNWPGPAFMLTPEQFTAARQFFPVTERPPRD